MYLLDVNVLLAAHRADHPHHSVVRRWFDGVVVGGAEYTVPDIVSAGFIRISTNRRIFANPTPMTDAFDFLESVRAQPGHIALVAGERSLELFRAVCIDDQATGDLVPDAYLAALALERGCAVASLDRDFARFRGVDWFDPSDSA